MNGSVARTAFAHDFIDFDVIGMICSLAHVIYIIIRYRYLKELGQRYA